MDKLYKLNDEKGAHSDLTLIELTEHFHACELNAHRIDNALRFIAEKLNSKL